MSKISNNRGFEAKLVVKRFLLTVSLPSYLFPLNTPKCVQLRTLWAGEDAKPAIRGGTQFAENNFNFKDGDLNVSFSFCG